LVRLPGWVAEECAATERTEFVDRAETLFEEWANISLPHPKWGTGFQYKIDLHLRGHQKVGGLFKVATASAKLTAGADFMDLRFQGIVELA